MINIKKRITKIDILFLTKKIGFFFKFLKEANKRAKYSIESKNTKNKKYFLVEISKVDRSMVIIPMMQAIIIFLNFNTIFPLTKYYPGNKRF